MNSEPVQDYILENKDNLRIGAAVSAAWPKAGERLVLGFLDRLRARLEEKLKEWEFDRWGCYLIDSSAGFDFWRPTWKEEYYVSLEFFDYGERLKFGLGRDASKEDIKNRSRCDELLTAVSKRYPTARAQNCWWEAWVSMQSPAADWQKPEVLWQMHKDPNFLNDVAEQLLEVAKISEPIVDRFVDRLARRK